MILKQISTTADGDEATTRVPILSNNVTHAGFSFFFVFIFANYFACCIALTGDMKVLEFGEKRFASSNDTYNI